VNSTGSGWRTWIVTVDACVGLFFGVTDAKMMTAPHSSVQDPAMHLQRGRGAQVDPSLLTKERNFPVMSFKKFVLATAVLCSASWFSALAQAPRGGSAEVAVGGGYSYLNLGDATDTTEPKNHGIFNAQASFNVTHRFSVGFEYAYSPLDTVVYENVTGTEHLQNYGAVARVGIFNAHVLMPYFVLAGGGLELTDKATQGNVSVSASQSGGYLGAGFGVNGYLGHHVGVRPEIRYQRQELSGQTESGVYFAGSGRNQVNATVDLFYTFGGRG
jgi:hypothetical protein